MTSSVEERAVEQSARLRRQFSALLETYGSFDDVPETELRASIRSVVPEIYTSELVLTTLLAGVESDPIALEDLLATHAQEE